MKRKVLKILIIIIAIIATFFSSFFIAIKLLDVTGNEKESMQNVTENKAIEEIEEEPTNNIEANSFEGIIAEVNVNEIAVENPEHLVDYTIYEADKKWYDEHKVIINGKVYVKAGYQMNLENVQIKDSDGTNIKISDLKVGDIINVETKDIEYNVSTIFKTLTSDNIILIKKKI
ncbi:MAG: hypothetical protein HFJ54_01865 [Clostridia bacterium]|nr:hypothetical protein [Clostridia bacterium]